jgi:hypothetical protein
MLLSLVVRPALQRVSVIVMSCCRGVSGGGYCCSQPVADNGANCSLRDSDRYPYMRTVSGVLSCCTRAVSGVLPCFTGAVCGVMFEVMSCVYSPACCLGERWPVTLSARRALHPCSDFFES